MKTVTSVLIVLLAWPLSASAQERNLSRGQGYVFFAAGVGNIGPGTANMQFGGGGEGFIYRGLGMGVEISPVMPWSTPSNLGVADFVIGLGSANVSYHILPATNEHAVEPFLTAGYSLFFRAGAFHGYNAGGGINVWLNKKKAIRFEAREHRSRNYHTLGFRLGVTFR